MIRMRLLRMQVLMMWRMLMLLLVLLLMRIERLLMEGWMQVIWIRLLLGCHMRRNDAAHCSQRSIGGKMLMHFGWPQCGSGLLLPNGLLLHHHAGVMMELLMGLLRQRSRSGRRRLSERSGIR